MTDLPDAQPFDDLPWLHSASADQWNLMLEPHPQSAGGSSGSLRAAVLPYLSAKTGLMPERGTVLLQTLYERFGPDRIVWSLKLEPHAAGWEFYLYNGPRFSHIELDDVATATSALLRWELAVTPDLQDFNPVSFDVEAQHLLTGMPIRTVNLYSNAGPNASACHRLTLDGLEYRTHYRRFRVDEEPAWSRALRTSAHVQHTPSTWLTTLPCSEVHLANKQWADGVYWVGTPFASAVELLASLAASQWKSAAVLLDAVRRTGSRLDHLFTDVGIDVRRTGSELRPVKLALYGTV